MSQLAFRVLGPLELERDGQMGGPDGAQARRLLCLFLIHANEVLSTDRLIEEFWGSPTPPRASKRLQVAISRLRAALHDEDASLLLSERTGYRLALQPGQLAAGAPVRRRGAVVAAEGLTGDEHRRRHELSLIHI